MIQVFSDVQGLTPWAPLQKAVIWSLYAIFLQKARSISQKALYAACENGSIETAKFLMEQGASAEDSHALRRAMDNKHYELALFLLENMKDPKAIWRGLVYVDEHIIKIDIDEDNYEDYIGQPAYESHTYLNDGSIKNLLLFLVKKNDTKRIASITEKIQDMVQEDPFETGGASTAIREGLAKSFCKGIVDVFHHAAQEGLLEIVKFLDSLPLSGLSDEENVAQLILGNALTDYNAMGKRFPHKTKLSDTLKKAASAGHVDMIKYLILEQNWAAVYYEEGIQEILRTAAQKEDLETVKEIGGSDLFNRRKNERSLDTGDLEILDEYDILF